MVREKAGQVLLSLSGVFCDCSTLLIQAAVPAALTRNPCTLVLGPLRAKILLQGLKGYIGILEAFHLIPPTLDWIQLK